MKGWLRGALGALAVALTVATESCHAANPAHGAAQLVGATRSGPERVFTRSVRHRPRISLVARLGDPSPAVAMAVAHDFGSEASIALGALVAARLRARGFSDADSRPQALGFVVRALAATPARAARFVTAASHALQAPVRAGDPALPAVARQLKALGTQLRHSPAEAAIAHCSGGLRAAPGSPLDPNTPSGRARLEAWRRSVATARSVAFGALGPARVLNAAAETLVNEPAWPDGAGPKDPWPDHDLVGVEAASNSERRLSIALRIDNAGEAIEAARNLGRNDSTLATREQALDPAWRVERVVGATRPRGACLRVDLTPSHGAAPSLPEVARATLVALEEAKIALAEAKHSPWALEDSVLRPADPRQAAAVAAWRALSGRLPPGAERRFVSYRALSAQASSGASAALAHALERAARSWRSQKLDERARVEAGQGEFWALLASPCGTSGEGSGEAGLSAVAMRALAVGYARVGHVRIEPWIAPDGVGLLAHAPRVGPNESPDAHAARVASALGRVFAVNALGGDAIARARAELRDELGPGPRPGFWLAVESAAPDHPSWLDPRGTWQAITNATPSAVEQERHEIVSGPLRLAVLADSSRSQVRAAARAVQRWVAPMRADRHACPRAAPEAPRHGEFTVETSASTEPNGAAYVAVPVAPGARSIQEAKWTVYLLNRSGGWLDQALRAPGLASSARAVALGGAHAAAIVIEVTAAGGQGPKAVAQVRGLLERLAAGALTARDVAAARRHFVSLQRTAWLEPRYRIVELWRGPSADPAPPTLSSLRAFQRASFAQAAPVVVYVKHRE